MCDLAAASSPASCCSADSIFRRLGGSRNVVRTAAPVSFVNCLFTQNFLEQAPSGLPLSLIHLLESEPLPGGLGAGLRLEAVTSISNPHPFTVSAGNIDAAAQVFSDFPLSTVVYADGPNGQKVAPETYEPVQAQALQDLQYNIDGEARFISERTPSFIERQLVRSPCHATAPRLACASAWLPSTNPNFPDNLDLTKFWPLQCSQPLVWGRPR